ncbi:MAG: 2-oxo acid dehydrogenase subunit E2 [Gammaproteobacteria bacterium]|nr:2-oxo acid dehydrogenase subunit E2 [Gammaproteobacteria bacterium]MDE0252382.1 2-oxo acid dehydrogenase subunit E2 [Gammaproteobacteria bacterium]MDE0402509.1 2-oxo acid dehydrogenase subunit E2 [Gammaproteobacteria bacterium]
MTSTTVEIPDLGDVESVEVIELCISEGVAIEQGDPLIVLESEKASMEVPAPVSGVIEKILVQLEAKVSSGDPIAIIQPAATDASVEVEKVDAESVEAESPEPVETPKVPQPPATPQPPEISESPEKAISPTTTTTTSETRTTSSNLYAGPAVRKLARELGVDLGQITATGDKGRILKDDVKAYVKQRLIQSASTGTGMGVELIQLPDFTKFGEVEVVPLSRIRKRAAQNLHRSWLSVAHVTQHDEVDVTELETFRQELNQRAPKQDRLTPLPFILKVCAVALQTYPQFNSSIDPSYDHLIQKKYYHLGVAVDTDDGLVVPVVRDVDQKGIVVISRDVKRLASLAVEKKLLPDDFSGATFTVSSLGLIGGTGFTPIVNAPEVAILGVGRLTTRPMWIKGAVSPRKMLPLSLSYDHRAINGVEAGRFMQFLRERLTEIRELLL